MRGTFRGAFIGILVGLVATVLLGLALGSVICEHFSIKEGMDRFWAYAATFAALFFTLPSICGFIGFFISRRDRKPLDPISRMQRWPDSVRNPMNKSRKLRSMMGKMND